MTQQSSMQRTNSKSVPSTGMRGGLGRTLLTAFLLLSIVPLSLISFVASAQARRNLQDELEEKLVTVASVTESQIYHWIADQQLILALLADTLTAESKSNGPIPLDGDYKPPPAFSRLAEQIQTRDLRVAAWLLSDQQGRVLMTYPSGLENQIPGALLQPQYSPQGAGNPGFLAFASEADAAQPVALLLTHPIAQSRLTLAALLDPTCLIETLDSPVSWNDAGEIYLVLPSGQALKLCPSGADNNSNDLMQYATRQSMAIEAALSGEAGAASYENYKGTQVIGAYRWLHNLNMALLVEQTQASALASSEELAVVLIGATLAVVLLTALIAATVTRRIALPIVQLTATAVEIASGDLNQKVSTTRRDEIGILARAFNVMTTKLRVLYEDLEQKVRERTLQLERANARTRYQAMQLAISAEVGRVVTSILDRDLLLTRVVELIRDCFQAYFVAIYFLKESGDTAVFQEGSGGLGKQLKAEDHRVDLNQDHLVSLAIRELTPIMRAGTSLNDYIDRQLFPHTSAELAVPLKVGRRIIGALDVHSTHEDAFYGDEAMVLETLSGQVAVAIENARAYAMEHQAVEQLRELEELRRGFLSNMSRELRMPLNNIIGFSRVILKGIDGPITDLQRQDVTAIFESGQQLLVLINDILDIAQIEAGEMELDIRPIDFGEVAHSVIPTASALIQGRPIEFRYEIHPDLPPVLADSNRLRQVLVKLLSNAAKFTQEGEITLRVWPDVDHIKVSVSDTGIGIPEKNRAKVFEMFHRLSQPGKSNARGTGLGLTFSKEIVEMHGGSIWLESSEGQGTVFTITLPAFKPDESNQHSGGI